MFLNLLYKIYVDIRQFVLCVWIRRICGSIMEKKNKVIFGNFGVEYQIVRAYRVDKCIDSKLIFN